MIDDERWPLTAECRDGLRRMADVARIAMGPPVGIHPSILASVAWIDGLPAIPVEARTVVPELEADAKHSRWSCTVSDPAGMAVACGENQESALALATDRFELEMGRALDTRLGSVEFCERPPLT